LSQGFLGEGGRQSNRGVTQTNVLSLGTVDDRSAGRQGPSLKPGG